MKDFRGLGCRGLGFEGLGLGASHLQVQVAECRKNLQDLTLQPLIVIAR